MTKHAHLSVCHTRSLACTVAPPPRTPALTARASAPLRRSIMVCRGRERMARCCRHGCRPSARCTVYGSSSTGERATEAAALLGMADDWRKWTVIPTPKSAMSTQASLQRRTRAWPRVSPSPAAADPSGAGAGAAPAVLESEWPSGRRMGLRVVDMKTIGSTTLRFPSPPGPSGRVLTLATRTAAGRLSITTRTTLHTG
jgi:hypothetical protein